MREWLIMWVCGQGFRTSYYNGRSLLEEDTWQP